MLEPTHVFSRLKSTPIILPWLMRTRLFASTGLAVRRPEEHQPDLRLRARAVHRRHELRVGHFLLENPGVRVVEGAEFVARRVHVHAETGEGIQRLEHVVRPEDSSGGSSSAKNAGEAWSVFRNGSECLLMRKYQFGCPAHSTSTSSCKRYESFPSRSGRRRSSSKIKPVVDAPDRGPRARSRG